MDNITDALEWVMTGIASLKNVLLPEAEADMGISIPKTQPTNMRWVA
jgi:hypothetical protein